MHGKSLLTNEMWNNAWPVTYLSSSQGVGSAMELGWLPIAGAVDAGWLSRELSNQRQNLRSLGLLVLAFVGVLRKPTIGAFQLSSD